MIGKDNFKTEDFYAYHVAKQPISNIVFSTSDHR